MVKNKKSKPSSSNVLADADQRKKFKTTLATITHHLQKIDDEKDAIKEIVVELADQSGVAKKTVRKLAMTMYKHNYASLQEENKHFESLYEMVIEGKLANDPDGDDEQEAA